MTGQTKNTLLLILLSMLKPSHFFTATWKKILVQFLTQYGIIISYNDNIMFR